jgi:hypothetical protein
VGDRAQGWSFVGDDGEEVGRSGRFGTAVVHVDGRLIRTVRIDR